MRDSILSTRDTAGRKIKIFADESTENDEILNGSQRFKVETYNVIIDRLLSCLENALMHTGT